MDNEVMNKNSKDMSIKIMLETYQKLIQVKLKTGASIKWLVDSAIEKIYPKKEE